MLLSSGLKRLALHSLQHSRLRFQVGLALKKLFQDGVVKREDLFVTSKLWLAFTIVPTYVAICVDRTRTYRSLNFRYQIISLIDRWERSEFLFFRYSSNAPQYVPEAIQTTLDDLQLEYLDLYLVSS